MSCKFWQQIISLFTAAVSPNRGVGRDSEGNFGDFVVRVFLLLVLVSIFAGFGPGIQQGGPMAVFVGGGLFLAIMVLAVDLWQNFLPFLGLIAFCMLFPKSSGNALGCLVTLVIIVFISPILLAGNILIFMFFAFLAMIFLKKTR